MTYVLGIRHGCTAAIYTDSRLSSHGQSVTHASLKGGVLFPGCIFGVSGDWYAANKFIVTAMKAVRHLTTDIDRWVMFNKVCEAYNPSDSSFEVLLSSRLVETPVFYLYISQRRKLVSLPGDLYMLGTGKSFFEPEVLRYHCHTLPELQRCGMPPDRMFYVLASQLQMFFASSPIEANTYEVGGIISFTLQTSRGEARQRPSLQVILQANADTHEVLVSRRRIAFDTHSRFGEVLVIFNKIHGLPLEERLLIQNRGLGHVKLTSRGTDADEASAIWERHRNSHPYEFLSIAVVEKEKFIPIIEFKRNDDYVLADLTDYLDESARNAVLGIFDSGKPPAGMLNFIQPASLIGQKWRAPDPPPLGEVRLGSDFLP